MSKYEHLSDGEEAVFPLGSDTFLACCDCGLVHKIIYYAGEVDETGESVVIMQAWRDNRRTGQKRRHMNIRIVK